MRSHHSEHSDSLPVIDITALKHAAYVFDALIYYMRTTPDSDVEALRDGVSVASSSWQDTGEDDHDDDLSTRDGTSSGVNVSSGNNNTLGEGGESLDGDSESGGPGGIAGGDGRLGRRHPFFQRSDSTIFMGCPPPDPFHTPLVEALPLADQPHLLQPNARREDYFGMAKPTLVLPKSSTEEGPISASASLSAAGHQLPLSLSLSVQGSEQEDRSQLAQSLRNATFQPIVPAPVTGSSGAASTGNIRSTGSGSVAAPPPPPTSVAAPVAAVSLASSSSASSSGTSAVDLRSTDMFPQSVAVNLSLSAQQVVTTAPSTLCSVSLLNIPLPAEPSHSHLQQQQQQQQPHSNAHPTMSYQESRSGTSSQLPNPQIPSSFPSFAVTFALPNRSSSSSASSYSSPQLVLSTPPTNVAAHHPTPSQLARDPLSAFSEIATSRERIHAPSLPTGLRNESRHPAMPTSASVGSSSGASSSGLEVPVSLPSSSSVPGPPLSSYQLHSLLAATSQAESSTSTTQASVIVHTASAPSTSSQAPTLPPGGATSARQAAMEGVEESQPPIRPKIHFAFLAWSQNQAANSSASGSTSSQGNSLMLALYVVETHAGFVEYGILEILWRFQSQAISESERIFWWIENKRN